jgi:hypothetical protein
MMNYPEYEQAKEYRERLLNMLESGRRTLSPKGFQFFSSSISGKVRQLEQDMAGFEESFSGSMCQWFGLRTFNVTAQIPRGNESNVSWNSPALPGVRVPVKIRASQQSLLPEEAHLPLPEPVLA